MSTDTRVTAGVAGFLLGATGMFATMYSTQAILPELSRDFAVSPSRAGLSISAVVLAMAGGAWLWGPLSDRIGRVRAMRLASMLLIAPTVIVAAAPTFEVLVGARALQGLFMPGLLVVGAPYVVEVLVPRVGARAMGWYASALVLGGLIGRVGVALGTSVVGWRTASALLTALPLAGVIAMRGLADAPAPVRGPRPLRSVISSRLIAVTVIGCALFFTFVGTFTFVTYRLEAPPFDLPLETASLVFLLWVLGLAGPIVGRLAERVGWRVISALTVAIAAGAVVATIPDRLWLVVVALACIATVMFAGYTASQLAVGDVARVDRGTASAFYFSAYYLSGAIGAFLPGIAWERWQWPGVVACDLVALGFAAVALAALRRSGPVTVETEVHPPYAVAP